MLLDRTAGLYREVRRKPGHLRAGDRIRRPHGDRPGEPHGADALALASPSQWHQTRVHTWTKGARVRRPRFGSASANLVLVLCSVALALAGCSGNPVKGKPARRSPAGSAEVPASEAASVVGKSVSLDGFDYTIVKAIDPYVPPPESRPLNGARLVALQITIHNGNDRPGLFRPGLFFVDQHQHALESSAPAPDNGTLYYTGFGPGESATAWSVLEVPAGTTSLSVLLRSPQGGGTKTLPLFGTPTAPRAPGDISHLTQAAAGRSLKAGPFGATILQVVDPFTSFVDGDSRPPPGQHAVAIQIRVTYADASSPNLPLLELGEVEAPVDRLDLLPTASQPDGTAPYRVGETRAGWFYFTVADELDASTLTLRLDALINDKNGTRVEHQTIPMA